jgi:hypothetical protein
MVIYMNAKNENKLNRDGIKYLIREFTSTLCYEIKSFNVLWGSVLSSPKWTYIELGSHHII